MVYIQVLLCARLCLLRANIIAGSSFQEDRNFYTSVIDHSMEVELTGSTVNTISSKSSTTDQENCSIESSKQKHHKIRCLSKALGCFKTSLFLLAVLGLTVVVILHSSQLNGRIRALEGQVLALKGELQSLEVWIGNSSTAERAHQMSVQLGSQVEAIRATLVSTNTSLHTMDHRTQQLLEMAARNISELHTHLQDLDTSLDSVNSSLRQRFNGCYEDQQLCTLFPVQDDQYFRACLTHTIPAYISVSYL